ncbi:hypothetical protein J437_LFUL008610 [Ladona fulva]|uniref:Uncharacterized protein n=1 Tax=Ladona fulva TaxID=123851 RepID=A0A8K0KGD9_LADFU|nr:hypothetical protein J437_LFUL008610 [Ladona fulva]
MTLKMNICDLNEVKAPDIKEKLTLHVKRRISGGLKDESNGKNADTMSGDDAVLLAVKKKTGKGKKKRGPKQSKKVKIKVEDVGTDEFSEERSVSCENAGVTPVNTTSGEGDEFTSTGTEDTTPPEMTTSLKDSPEPSTHPKHPHDCNSSQGESVLNNTILNEILNERKRALFESVEVLEYLRKRINNT